MGVAIRKIHFLECLKDQDFSKRFYFERIFLTQLLYSGPCPLLASRRGATAQPVAFGLRNQSKRKSCFLKPSCSRSFFMLF